jgi:hypothetical protein
MPSEKDLLEFETWAHQLMRTGTFNPRKKGSSMPEITVYEIEQIFTYHKPEGDQPAKYEKLREAAKAFALTILECVPICADQSAAIRHVREAVMTANAAIALKGRV